MNRQAPALVVLKMRQIKKMLSHESITHQWTSLFRRSGALCLEITNEHEIVSLVRVLRAQPPGFHVVFLDADLSDFGLLEQTLNRIDPKIPLVLYLFKHLVANQERWEELHRLLKGRIVRWICISQFVASAAKLRMKNREACFVIPPPLIAEGFAFDEKTRNQVRRKLGIQPNERLILYPGRVIYQKNLHVFLQEALPLLQLYKRWRIHIVGGLGIGDPNPINTGSLPSFAYFTMVKRVLSQAPFEVRSRVSWSIAEDRKMMKGLYCAADLTCTLSTCDDFGLVSREALLCGSPVLTTDYGGHKDIVGCRGLYAIRTCVKGQRALLNRHEIRSSLVSIRRKPGKDRLRLSQFAHEYFGYMKSQQPLDEALVTVVRPNLGLAPAKNPHLLLKRIDVSKRRSDHWVDGFDDWRSLDQKFNRAAWRSNPAFELAFLPFSYPYVFEYPALFLEQTDPGNCAGLPKKILIRSGRQYLSQNQGIHDKAILERKCYFHAEVNPPGLEEVGKYRVVSCVKNKVHTILVIGPQLVLPASKSQIQLLKTQLLVKARRLKVHKFLVLNAIPENPSSQKSVSKFKTWVQAQNSHFKIEMVTFESLITQPHLFGVGVFEINTREDIADDFCLHRVLSLGAQLLDPKDTKKKVSHLQLVSPFHGFEFIDAE
jgi:glycosyltransferase involved in cell wall biosynthesis